MYNVKKVNEDLYWIGASDRRLALFENIYPIPRASISFQTEYPTTLM